MIDLQKTSRTNFSWDFYILHILQYLNMLKCEARVTKLVLCGILYFLQVDKASIQEVTLVTRGLNCAV